MTDDEPILPDEDRALASFRDASERLLETRVLQKRVDSKFIVSRSQLPDLLESLSDDFHVVLSNGARSATYDNTYFDTPDFDLFHEHRRGRRPRHKVRIRHYAERDVCFLETKTKDRYSVTTKHRFQRDPNDFDLRLEDVEQVQDVIGLDEPLQTAIQMSFPRITLLGAQHQERLTIDLGLWFAHDGQEAVFSDVSVIELKQKRFDAQSPGWRALRAASIRPHGISKYCVGLAVLGRVDRVGLFLPAIRELERRHA